MPIGIFGKAAEKTKGKNMNTTNINKLTNGHIAQTLLKFAIPYLISHFLVAMYGAADVFIVGYFAARLSSSFFILSITADVDRFIFAPMLVAFSLEFSLRQVKIL